MTPLPTLSLDYGHDTHGKPVRLGDTDTDGYPVVYIDPGGLAHESHLAAESSRACGMLADQLTLWRQSKVTPDPLYILEAHVSPQNRPMVWEAMHESATFEARMRSLARHSMPEEAFPFLMPLGVDREAPFGA